LWDRYARDGALEKIVFIPLSPAKVPLGFSMTVHLAELPFFPAISTGSGAMQ